MRYLLDSHILIWWFLVPDRLSEDQREVLDAASGQEPLWVSDMTLWEIATVVQLGRIELNLPLREWLEAATAPPLVRRFGITPAVASEVASLPAGFHRDPGDRVIVSTARVLGATLVTRDRRIIQSNLVPTLGQPE